MLRHLTIKNYALIKHLELEPSPQLNVITGETGAGKSIMLGAIGLLMGNRADSKVLWNEDEKCIIEGTYDVASYKLKNLFREHDLDYDDTTVMRREVSPGGKSRAFINDTPVTLEVLRSVGARLMDVHSQHETLQLGNQAFQLRLIDTFAGNSAAREQYLEGWTSYSAAKKHFEDLTEKARSLREEGDYVNFQLDELVKAALDDADQEELESQLKVMEHAEEIKTRFHAIAAILSRPEEGALSMLAAARSQLQPVSGFSPAYQTLLQRLESTRVELADLAAEFENAGESIDFDPANAELIREKLSMLYRLQKKHRVSTVAELLSIRSALEEKASLTSNLDDALAKARSAMEDSEKKMLKLAAELSALRKKTFEPLARQMVKLLKALGIPNAVLQVDAEQVPPSSTGVDRIDILFSANKGISARPLAQVASGGEFSRLMFAIKYIMAEKTSLPTLILDEIDNGVSGEIAIQLGNMMREMSRGHQVIAISHLPQIAAKGDAHYFVYKDDSEKKTVSSVRRLSDKERVEEIAKMLGGANPSKIARENAQELLAG